MQTSTYDLQSTAESIIQDHSDNILNNITIRNNNNRDYLVIPINRDYFVKEILDTNKYELSPPTVHDVKNKRVVVEFSSPNIAKPFHVGHLRSTIIGNYISNLNKFLDNNVTKINYLGDWGTQLGMVKIGLDLNNISDHAMKADPIKELYNVYVHANKLAETDLDITKQARDIFKKLEHGDIDQIKHWEELKKYTTLELEKIYKRIGVSFDEYNWESDYSAVKIQELIDKMKKLNILRIDTETQRQVVGVKKKITILKSNGCTLYITRDIAAAIDRAEKYNFDMMYYVVDAGQFEHFKNLFAILEKMNLPWANRLQHVKFGKIRGMSTRKGTAVFLTDFLDEACTTMREQQSRTASKF